jgi:hypothetical protein
MPLRRATDTILFVTSAMRDIRQFLAVPCTIQNVYVPVSHWSPILYLAFLGHCPRWLHEKPDNE